MDPVPLWCFQAQFQDLVKRGHGYNVENQVRQGEVERKRRRQGKQKRRGWERKREEKRKNGNREAKWQTHFHSVLWEHADLQLPLTNSISLEHISIIGFFSYQCLSCCMAGSGGACGVTLQSLWSSLWRVRLQHTSPLRNLSTQSTKYLR